MSLSIRPAQVSDSAFLAEMFSLSMGGLADHLFADAPLSVTGTLRALIARDAGRFGFGLAHLAEEDGSPAGALVACPGARLDGLALSVFPHLFPVLGLAPALRFIARGIALPGGREALRGEFYISNLGVVPGRQGRGLGSRLLSFAEDQARSLGLQKCALLVGLYNGDALRLYQRLGYRIVESVPHADQHLAYHRLVKQLS